jgi:hypothetical protein
MYSVPLQGVNMGVTAEEKQRRLRGRSVTHRLTQATILLGGITALAFLLPYIPKFAELTWLRPLLEIAGACDGVIFFALMYWQLASDRAELIAPMGDAIKEIGGLLQPLQQEMTGIREELYGVNRQMVEVSNTRWLPDSNAFIGRLGIEMNSAITSEPHRPKAILLMRLSGHWKMNERLEHAAELRAKFFDTSHTAGRWAGRWEVQMLYAVSDDETFTALLNERVILGRVLSARPTNYKFRLIPRIQSASRLSTMTLLLYPSTNREQTPSPREAWSSTARQSAGIASGLTRCSRVLVLSKCTNAARSSKQASTRCARNWPPRPASVKGFRLPREFGFGRHLWFSFPVQPR